MVEITTITGQRYCGRIQEISRDSVAIYREKIAGKKLSNALVYITTKFCYSQFRLIIGLSEVLSVERLELEKVIEICRAHGTRKIALFGSFVRGEARPDSDVDLIVDFDAPTGLLALVRLERELSEILGRKVDLLTENAISPHLRARILSEQRVIYDAAG